MAKEKEPVTCILIDAEKRTIQYLEIVPELKAFYKVLNCSLVEACYPFPPDMCYIDEEGNLKNENYGVEIENYGVLTGNILILGNGKDGYETNCKATIEDIKPKIRFLGLLDILHG